MLCHLIFFFVQIIYDLLSYMQLRMYHLKYAFYNLSEIIVTVIVKSKTVIPNFRLILYQIKQ